MVMNDQIEGLNDLRDAIIGARYAYNTYKGVMEPTANTLCWDVSCVDCPMRIVDKVYVTREDGDSYRCTCVIELVLKHTRHIEKTPVEVQTIKLNGKTYEIKELK